MDVPAGSCPPAPVTNTTTLTGFSCRVDSQLLVGVTGLATVSVYQQLLRGLLYDNTADEPDINKLYKNATVSIATMKAHKTA